MKLYVGNLSFHTTAGDLQAAFEPFGTVAEVALISDRLTGCSRGFAFVTMDRRAEGQAAINGLQGRELDGRALSVNEARRREERFGGDRPGWASRPWGAKEPRWLDSAASVALNPALRALGDGTPGFEAAPVGPLSLRAKHV